AVRLQPSHFWARYGLALGALGLQHLPAARDGLTACLGQRPRFAWLYTLRGFVHGELGDFTAAVDDFATALSLDPDAATRYGVFANRGVLRRREAESIDALALVRCAAPYSAAGQLAAGLAE